MSHEDPRDQAARRAPLLRVSGLEIGYGATSERAVAGVDFEVWPGEIVSIVGESGSGKSTTVAALLGLLPETARIHAGSIQFEGADVVGLSERAFRRLLGGTVGYVPQDPVVSLDPVKTVGHQIDEVFRLHGRLSVKDAKHASIEVLRRVGIDRPAQRHGQYPHELSGGMRQRVLIAIALAGAPRLIVADEPTSGLDVTVQRRVLDELVALARDEGVAVVLVTHDLGVAHDRSQRILVMQHGRIVEQGDVTDVFAAPRHPYTQRLLEAVPSLHAHPLRTVTLDDRRAPLLRAESLRKEFRVGALQGSSRRLTAVDDVSLSVRPGSTLGIVGESGSGKTTLARILGGLTPPTTGSVHVGDQDIWNLRRGEQRELRRNVQYVYQNPYTSLDPRFSVQRVIAEPLKAIGVGNRAQRRARALELLDLVALPRTVAERTPVELSGGQRQRVAIARALALNPRLLILDEPVSALDVSVQDQVLRVLVDVQDALGLTYVFISHDLAVIRLVADEVLVLSGGRVVEAGRTADVFAHPQDDYTRALLDAIPGSRGAGRGVPRPNQPRGV